MSACPDKTPLLHGLLDGELDAVNAAAFEAHLKTCEACNAEYLRLLALRGELATPEVSHRAPERLRSNIEAMLAAEAEPAPAPAPKALRRAGWTAGGALGGLLAAGLAVMIVIPQMSAAAMDRQLVAGHVRSLLANHLTDVATSNQHVVRPWFNGKVDIAPPVPELADQGFPLVGGRLDYLDGRVTPAIVYKRRLHTVNLFVLPAGGAGFQGERTARRDGYSIVEWTAGGLRYAAVSDIDLNDLKLFRQTFIAHASS
ncbi:anti-sigma factor [Phenylobacterium sp.]|uniref:anti-sigma factor family protein n=1 Tax=Phenylobacterium sp. TaxID=1871053 RepID=UPI00122BEE16|nr:zf-HC2 domain-containing protein [Phenylobacterium sp.]THD58325.1 MAG: anti-sigma factor [Phenylobacterium sp.]